MAADVKVLVVEDVVETLALMGRLVEAVGHTPLLAGYCSEALALFSRHSPVVALVDWMMPDMDGLELVRRLRQQQGERPLYIVMMTCRSEANDRAVALAAGADVFVTKPTSVRTILAQLDHGARRAMLHQGVCA